MHVLPAAVAMLLLLDQTLTRILFRGAFVANSGFGALGTDGSVRYFWRKTAKEENEPTADEAEKKRQLEERQNHLRARGLPQKRPIPGGSRTTTIN